MVKAPYKPGRTVLIVHPDVAALAAFQATLAQARFTAVVARDLPTALLAISHHYFEVAIISSRIAEEGDGWALAGVARQAFPSAFLAVIVPENSVAANQAAINHGVSEVYEKTVSPNAIAADVLRRTLPAVGRGEKPREAVQ